MPRHLLVASDLSARSERALRRAFRLADLHDAEVSIVTVVDEDLPEPVAGPMLVESKASLQRLAASISARPCEIHAELGDPVTSILARVASSGADLLVLGVHRIRPLIDIFFGTTMERIVANSTGPVLLVRDPADHEYRRLLCGIDLSPACAAALIAAADLAPEAEIATFHAVHIPFRGFVAPPAMGTVTAGLVAEARQALDTWWDASTLPETAPRPEPVAVSRHELLARSLAAASTDLLVVGAHGRMLPVTPELGGFTRDILRDPPCDVLVVRR
jgi:nucleotide-binding universal stress UspA family protein